MKLVARNPETAVGLIAASMAELRGVEIPVLDHGSVVVLDWIGDDAAIVQAARTCTGSGRDGTGLINYLRRHRHTSPFEMCELKILVKLPIFVARQWVRHRTASINEVSARYSVLPGEFYVPEGFKSQDTKNRQGSADPLPADLNAALRAELIQHCARAETLYQRMLDAGVSRELARLCLPLNTYTSWVWKCDLHNLLHFLTLRCDQHAQAEIRAYADVIAEIVRLWVPVTYAAWRGSHG
jgi:thymidylate synthase (FAD)